MKYEALREELKKSDADQISTTDKDVRSMPINHNRIEVSYNAQTVVDSKNCLIVHYENTNVHDKKALARLAIETKNILQKESIEVRADKGYHNAEQIQACSDNNIVTYVPAAEPARFTDVPAPDYYGEKFRYDQSADVYICPKGNAMTTNGSWYDKKYKNTVTKLKQYKTKACRSCPVKHLCTSNPKGRIIDRKQYAQAVEANAARVLLHKEKYLLRQQIVEHPFGTIKRQWGFDYLLMKELKKNEAEFGLIFSVYNLRRILSILGIPELIKRLGNAFLFLFMLTRSVTRHFITFFFRSYRHSISLVS